MANIIEEGNVDGSFNCDFPSECAELFLHMLNFWCDPVIFECDMSVVRKRLCCMQQLMKKMGVDIITDEIIEIAMQITEKMYDLGIAQNE